MFESSRHVQGLEWLVGEVEASLTEACNALESYIAQDDDVSQLRFCKGHIHQVAGSLKIAECHGGVLLGEQMEALVQGLLDDKIADREAAVEVLLKAFIEVPRYLQNCITNCVDEPSVLISILNDHRALRNESLVSGGSVFNPDLSFLDSLPGRIDAPLANEKVILELIDRLSHVYQYALLDLSKNKEAAVNLNKLLKVLNRLEEVFRGARLEQMWRVAAAVLGGLKTGVVDSGPAVKSLLWGIDSHIRKLAKEGISALDEAFPAVLFKNLLYYLAVAKPSVTSIATIQSDYKLDQALPSGALVHMDDGLIPSYDRSVINALVKSLSEEIELAKAKLNSYLDEGGNPQQTLENVVPVFERIADTLAMVGQSRLRQLVQEISESLTATFSETEFPGAEEIGPVATRLVDLDIALKSWLVNYQKGGVVKDDLAETTYLLDDAQSSLVREVRNNIETIKEAVVGYISSRWDSKFLLDIPALLGHIGGALTLVDLERPARVARHLQRYVSQRLLGETEPDWSQLDALADAITGIEFYLEEIARGNSEDRRGLIDIAESGIARLPVEDIVGGAVDSVPRDVPASPVVESVVEPEPEPEPERALEDETIDPELVDIFVEEASEILGGLREAYPRWQRTRSDQEALVTVRRFFHSLKGSGRVAGATYIGELGAALEELFNRHIDGGLSWSIHADATVAESLLLIPRLIESFKAGRQQEEASPVSQLVQAAQAVLNGEIPSFDYVPAETTKASSAALLAETEEHVDEVGDTTVGAPSEFIEGEIAVDAGSTPAETVAEIGEVSEVAAPKGAESDLQTIFAAEAEEYLDVLSGFVSRLGDNVYPGFGDEPTVFRALHMLKGSARVAEQTAIGEVAEALEGTLSQWRNSARALPDTLTSLLADSVAALYELLGNSADPAYVEALAQSILQRHREQKQTVQEIGAQRQSDLDALIIGGLQEILETDEWLLQWCREPSSYGSRFDALLLELSALCDAAKDEAKVLGELADRYRETLSALADVGGADETQADTLLIAHSMLLSLIDAYASGPAMQPPARDAGLLDKLRALAAEADAAVVVPPIGESETDLSLEAELAVSDAGDVPSTEPVEVEPAASVEATTVGTSPSHPEDMDSSQWEESIDPEIAAIFREEAEELLEQIEQAIQSWRDSPNDSANYETLTRELHTLKGGARVAGFSAIGDFSHSLESFLEEQYRHTNLDVSFFDTLLQRYDELVGMIDRAGRAPELAEQAGTDSVVTADHEETSPQAFADSENLAEEDSGDREAAAGEAPLVLETVEDEASDSIEELERSASDGPASDSSVAEKPSQESPVGKSPAQETPNAPAPSIARVIPFQTHKQFSRGAPPGGGKVAAAGGSQEMVKVAAHMLDNIVNLAGETSIASGRVEQEVTEFAAALEEMDATVERLQDQVRRLGIENEAQIQYRREQIGEEGADFDPLELDRYSQLQQLSRALMESASDLQELKGNLLERFKTAESLLFHQSRVNSDLQENLTQTQMTPFAKLVPRLRRVVRQVSSDLDKPVKLELSNIDGEMDRTILGKLVGPLEHMIRNAIDHGIEDPEGRRQADKPEEGTIALIFNREGGEVVIKVTDDGKGLDAESIRRQAVNRGIIAGDAVVDEEDLLQLIFLPGFSTSSKVSQVSGRGVGLDVVANEVRELGGSISLNSRRGMGTSFTIRLPFTVAVNSALMVRVGGDRYAVPVNTVMGVVRLSARELAACHESGGSMLSYGGVDYHVCYLGQLLDARTPAPFVAEGEKAPLVLASSENRHFAVQVDRVDSSQEIVVKGLGPLFNGVTGLSGVTLMGNGEVLVILDLLALCRRMSVRTFARNSDEMVLPDLIPGSALPSAANEPEPEELEVTGGYAEADLARPLSILVVDDSVTVRKVTSRFLEREGYRVHTAKDGVEAIDAIRDLKPDLMLLDIEMPRMDGFEVARLVRNTAETKDLPIIMISSRSGEKHKEKALGCGVNLFLGKPYQEDNLLAAIKSMFAAGLGRGGGN